MEKICIVKRRKKDYGPAAPLPSERDRDMISVELTAQQAEMVRTHPGLQGFFAKGEPNAIYFNLYLNNTSPSRMLKRCEVCEMLQVSRGTLAKLTRAGTMKSYRIGRLRRFKVEDVMEYLSGTLRMDRQDRLSALPSTQPRLCE